MCPGTCWRRVSGGEIDGDHSEELKWYRYGGMWKNKHEAVSAKKPKRKVKKSADAAEPTEMQAAVVATDMEEWVEDNRKYTRNDRVLRDGRVWICRKSHSSKEGRPPEASYSLWKENDAIIED